MILVIFFCVWEKIDNGKNSVSRKIGGSYVRLFIYKKNVRRVIDVV